MNYRATREKVAGGEKVAKKAFNLVSVLYLLEIFTFSNKTSSSS